MESPARGSCVVRRGPYSTPNRECARAVTTASNLAGRIPSRASTPSLLHRAVPSPPAPGFPFQAPCAPNTCSAPGTWTTTESYMIARASPGSIPTSRSAHPTTSVRKPVCPWIRPIIPCWSAESVRNSHRQHEPRTTQTRKINSNRIKHSLVDLLKVQHRWMIQRRMRQ